MKPAGAKRGETGRNGAKRGETGRNGAKRGKTAFSSQLFIGWMLPCCEHRYCCRFRAHICSGGMGVCGCIERLGGINAAPVSRRRQPAGQLTRLIVGVFFLLFRKHFDHNSLLGSIYITVLHTLSLPMPAESMACIPTLSLRYVTGTMPDTECGPGNEWSLEWSLGPSSCSGLLQRAAGHSNRMRGSATMPPPTTHILFNNPHTFNVLLEPYAPTTTTRNTARLHKLSPTHTNINQRIVPYADYHEVDTGASGALWAAQTVHEMNASAPDGSNVFKT